MAHCKAQQLDMHGFCNRFDAPCIKKNCRFFGVKTIADRIRAMSDEELAKMFMDFSEKLLNEYGVVGEAKTTEYVLEWLKQPAEED